MVAVAAAGYAVWGSTRPRTIGVCVVTDYAFRGARPDWHEALAGRFEAANRAFRGTGVEWEFHEAGQPDPTRALASIEERRRKLIRTECDADVILGITSLSGANGDVPPFAHTALIADIPSDGEPRNTDRFIRCLAALFGTPANSSEPLPAPSRKLIASLRRYDFAAGTAALDGAWRARVFDALAAANNPNGAAEAHRIMGLSLAADGRSLPAIRELKERARLDPRNPAAHLDLASVYTHRFDTAEAIAEFREAVRVAPDNAPAHAALAVALANTGLAEDAADEFHTALRLDPKFATALSGLGYVLSQQPGRIDEAIDAYEQALRINPDLAAAVEGLDRAKSLKSDAAVDVSERRRKTFESPADPACHFDLALSEARAGNVDGAVQELRRTVELDSSYGLAQEQLALLLYRKGDYAEALAHAGEAARAGYDPPRDVVERLERHAGKRP